MSQKNYLWPIIGLIILGLLEIVLGIVFISSGFNAIIAAFLLIKGPIFLVVAAVMYRLYKRNIELQTTPLVIQSIIV
jgi:membrane protein implicated in regulation of membrane protease activity